VNHNRHEADSTQLTWPWRAGKKSPNLAALKSALPDHYAALGLDRRCTAEQIRAAYRLLAKQHHPDVNGDARAALTRTQELNAAYEILSEPARRAEYDQNLSAPEKPPVQNRSGQSAGNLTKEVHLRLEEFLRGAKLEVRVNDAGNPAGAETYELIIPPATAPGARFKIPRHASAGRSFVIVRVRARPDFRFKPRGSDLRCDLKVSSQRAEQGGTESVRGVNGNYLRVPIPKKVARGEIIRIAGEGLPKPRGGRGDLLVRVSYRPEIRVTRRRS
jgi:curved DNA-binding protein